MQINIANILVPKNRQRKLLREDRVVELQDSIVMHGILHPIVVRDITDRDKADFPDIEMKDKFMLVAGETRLAAMRRIVEKGAAIKFAGAALPASLIPCTLLGELDELKAAEVELEENTRRTDLTWQDQAAAIKALNDLRQAQRLAKINSALNNPALAPESLILKEIAPEYTLTDLAEEVTGHTIGGYVTKVSNALIVAEHLDNPAVREARSLKEAMKALRREEETKSRIALAREVGRSYSSANLKVLKQDALDFMRDTANLEQFNLILTDPPYGMGADEFGDSGTPSLRHTHEYEDNLETWKPLMIEWAELSYKVAALQAHAYVFCDIDRFQDLKLFMTMAGWYVFRTPLIWKKGNSGRVPLPDRGPRRQYEIILYAIKGAKKVNAIYTDVIDCPADDSKFPQSHAAQKPVGLYLNLMLRSAKAGDKVLDTFAGSGTIFEAAYKMQCDAVGIEKHETSYGICLERLKYIKQFDPAKIEKD